MLDGVARKCIDPVLNAGAAALAVRGVHPHAITVTGFVTGIAGAAAIALSQPVWLCLTLVLLSRLADGLDGAVARASGRTTALGGFLDIVLDFAFYGAIPLAFALRMPETNALPAATLLFAFYVNGASFLAYAAIAAKSGLDATPRGPKALVFSAGLAEATETLLIFCAMMIWPNWFPVLAWCFSALCLLTAALRIRLAVKSFRE